MSGSDVPYQLRPNKYIERHLFFDALDYVRMWNGPSSYLYASMGGRFLEDFKLLNDKFPVNVMISFEGNQSTSERQRFNNPLTFIKCYHQMSGDFVNNFDTIYRRYRKHKFIIWLDYADQHARQAQLSEFQDLLSKLGPGDVAKITMNANYEYAVSKATYPLQIKHQNEVLRLLELQLGDYMPVDASSSEMEPEGFANVLARAIRKAVVQGVREVSGRGVKLLTLFRYSDGRHQMLTATVVITNSGLDKKIEGDRMFKRWLSRSRGWDDIHLIDIPDLSIKERARIHERLFKDVQRRVHKTLPFRLADTDKESIRLFSQYVRYYRRYPNFQRAWV